MAEKKLSREEIAEFREAFNLFDNDSSGTISSKELINAMMNLNLKPTEDEIQALINQIDCDGGGSIDFHEFLALMSKKMIDMKREEDIVQTFRVFDRDRNGLITTAELHYAMNKMGFKMSHEEAKRMIKEADANGDGLLNYEEFYRKMMKD